MVLFIKGLIIGIGKILPGISGSVLAIALNVYEDAIEAICNIIKNFNKNIVYLGKLGLGIIISIVLGSKLLLYFLNKYYFYTFSIIIGFIIGTIPSVLKNAKLSKKKDLLYLIIPFLVIWLINIFKFNFSYKSNIIIYVLIGLFEAFSTIIPGISSTAIYMMFDIYDLYLKLFIKPFSISFMLFLLGFTIGIYLTSKLINYLFKNYKRRTYLIIVSLLLSSIIILIKNLFLLNEFELPKFILIALIGFVISKHLN